MFGDRLMPETRHVDVEPSRSERAYDGKPGAGTRVEQQNPTDRSQSILQHGSRRITLRKRTTPSHEGIDSAIRLVAEPVPPHCAHDRFSSLRPVDLDEDRVRQLEPRVGAIAEETLLRALDVAFEEIDPLLAGCLQQPQGIDP